MMAQALKQFPLPTLTVIALFLFGAVFLGVVVRTCFFTTRAEADHQAHLVIDNSEMDRRTP